MTIEQTNSFQEMEGYKSLASHFSYSHSNEATNDPGRMHENAEKNALAAKSNPFFVRPESVRVHSLSLSAPLSFSFSARPQSLLEVSLPIELEIRRQ